MAAYQLTTFWATPRFLLRLQEFCYSILLDKFKVANEAHSIKRSVSLVNMFQIFAGEVSTLVAELYFVVQQQRAFLL
jgi:hypothetical protein